MNNYFEKNYEVLINKGDFYKKILDEECEECNVFLDADSNGNEIIGIVKNDRNWYLGSRYDNQYAMNVWLDSIEVDSYRALICVFGLGDYKNIEKLVEKYTDNPIIIYEPNVSYLRTMLEVYNMTEVIGKSNVAILAGQWGMKCFKDMLYVNLDVTNYKTSIFKINTQYATLYSEELKKWNENVQDSVSLVMVDKNTYMLYAKERFENSLKNYFDCVKSRNIKELIESLNKENVDTAILVSAGPSLDKNVHLLEKVKNKAFIMAVDTAIKPVLKAGVTPDLTITVDSHKPKELFMLDDQYLDIPMIVCLQSNADVLEKYRGKRFYSYNFDKSFYNIYQKEDYMEICLDSGGSVANDAFSFLVKCGFKNIIFIGQDLAYSNTKTHAGNAYDKEDVIKFEKSDRHFLIEDIYGNSVYTEENMNLYRKWFEKNILNYKDINFVDATEGGAKIEGTKIMNFSEAIDLYIKDLEESNFEENIAQLENLPADELNRRMNIFKNIPEEIKETKNKINRAMKLYDELDALNRSNKQGSSRVSKIASDIDVLVEQIEESVYAAFMANVVDDTEYDVLEEIYEDKKSVYEEIKLIVDSGKKILGKYIDKYEEISTKINEMVEVSLQNGEV